MPAHGYLQVLSSRSASQAPSQAAAALTPASRLQQRWELLQNAAVDETSQAPAARRLPKAPGPSRWTVEPTPAWLPAAQEDNLSRPAAGESTGRQTSYRPSPSSFPAQPALSLEAAWQGPALEPVKAAPGINSEPRKEEPPQETTVHTPRKRRQARTGKETDLESAPAAERTYTRQPADAERARLADPTLPAPQPQGTIQPLPPERPGLPGPHSQTSVGVEIGTIEITVRPANSGSEANHVPPAARSALSQAPALPGARLSRGYTSSFGLRQG